jgi:hypothetical protein
LKFDYNSFLGLPIRFLLSDMAIGTPFAYTSSAVAEADEASELRLTQGSMHLSRHSAQTWKDFSFNC